jgi:hypothetical protein
MKSLNSLMRVSEIQSSMQELATEMTKVVPTHTHTEDIGCYTCVHRPAQPPRLDAHT